MGNILSRHILDQLTNRRRTNQQSPHSIDPTQGENANRLFFVQQLDQQRRRRRRILQQREDERVPEDRRSLRRPLEIYDDEQDRPSPTSRNSRLSGRDVQFDEMDVRISEGNSRFSERNSRSIEPNALRLPSVAPPISASNSHLAPGPQQYAPIGQQASSTVDRQLNRATVQSSASAADRRSERMTLRPRNNALPLREGAAVLNRYEEMFAHTGNEPMPHPPRMNITDESSGTNGNEMSANQSQGQSTPNSLIGDASLPITIIVNVLNRLRPEPPVNSIISTVVQALMVRNPSFVSSRQNIPFLVIIRSPIDVDEQPATVSPGANHDSSINDTQPVQPRGTTGFLATGNSLGTNDANISGSFLLDIDGNFVQNANTPPDYSIYVTDTRFFTRPTGSTATNEPFVDDLLHIFSALTATTYEDLLRLEDLIGYGHTLLTQASVDEHLKSVLFGSLLEKFCDKCPICLSLFKHEDSVRQLHCRHVYHQDCIDTWLTGHRNSCPLCRRVAVDDAQAASL